MASPKLTSLNLSTALVNTLNVIEQLQSLTISADNTTVDGRGIADRYALMQVTKQKQTVEMNYHWYDSVTELEATNLDISLWDLGGTAFVAQLKSGSLDITNGSIETSGINETYEYTQVTSTHAQLTSNLLLVSATGAVWTQAIMTDTVAEMALLVSITFAGETISMPGVLKSSKYTIRRGEAEMEDVVIQLQGTPTTPGDVTSLIYAMLVGSALSSFEFAGTGGTFQTGGGQDAAMTRMNLRFQDKNLVDQTLTLEMQGGMTA